MLLNIIRSLQILDNLREEMVSISKSELEALRTLLEDVTEVAQEKVDQFHSAYKGYKPDRHAYYDELMTKARAAIKDLNL